MIKKIIIVILALLPTVVQAQVAVGGWTLYTPFLGVDEIAETEVYVYYRSGTSLFRVDKESMEVASMNISNYLNDSGITGIFDVKDKKSLIVAYESGNMDRLYDDGSILNLPDIKDAVISGSRKINDIAFGKDNFYVAADFGLVTYNGSKNEVNESLFTPNPVNFVFTMGDIVGIHCGTQMRFARQSTKITSLDKIPLVGGYSRANKPLDIRGFGDNGVLVDIYDGGKKKNIIYTLKVDLDNQNITEKWFDLEPFNGRLGSLGESAYAVNSKGLYMFSTAWNEPELKELPRTDAATVPFSFMGNFSSVWIGDGSGMKQVDYTNVASPKVLHDGIKGSDLTLPAIHAMHVGSSGRIYLYNLGERLTVDISLESPSMSYVNIYENSTFKDVSGRNVSKKNPSSYSKSEPYFVNANFHLWESPDNDGSYYIGTLFEGCYQIKDGIQYRQFYTDNTPLNMQYGNWACNVAQPIVDSYGNLWLYAFGNQKNDSGARFFVLPADKRLKENVAIADWKSYSVRNYTADERDCFGILCRNTDRLMFFPGRFSKQIILFDTKGTQTLSDDAYLLVESQVDQDGKYLSYESILCATEDKKGRVWIGTNDGVFEITDPSKIASSTISVNHLKVPRNDGTNLADYLLSSQMVSSIAVDPSNRKWIATIGSGVYLVSENGDEIIEHFTEANSILPNVVYAVACDPNSNKVYFGTANGLVEYSSTSAPGSESYDNVYAYPNPVRPDYTGWITVTGLMNNSLVKISDSAGNVFYQGRSDGGMFTWDGCNAAGERVKTGVYYVYASQNENGDASACVTKIMVIN